MDGVGARRQNSPLSGHCLPLVLLWVMGARFLHTLRGTQRIG